MTDSKQKYNKAITNFSKEEAKELYDELNNWGFSTYDIGDRIELLKALDRKFGFSKNSIV